MILIKRQCGIYHIVSLLMLYNIIVVFAQPERETIGERVYARVKQKRGLGRWFCCLWLRANINNKELKNGKKKK